MQNKIDYAIIGGGISGIYCAWRLKEAYPDKHIQLFEFSNRIGGRLLTVQLPGMPDVNAELGGMRYIPSEQKLMDGLIETMGLETKDFPMGGKDDPTGNKNYAYFRENHMLVGQLSDSELNPYKLKWSERGLGPEDLQAKIMKLLVPEYDKLSFDDWFNVKVLGKPLWQYGFWNLLFEVLSPQAYRFIREASGYDTNVSNGNAIFLLPTGGEYDGSTGYRTPVKGMQAVPNAVAEKFLSLSGTIHKNQCLQQILRKDGANYSLRFAKTSTVAGKTTVDIPYEQSEELAEHIILAMPRRSLEKIQWNQWQENSFLRENLSSVLIQSAFKMVLGYDYAWWKSLGLEAGRSITDLPIRQTLYFGEQPTQSSNPMDLPKALLMASYNDITTVPFWKGLEQGEAFGQPPATNIATQRMVEEAHRQVLELHGQKDLPQPYTAAYQDWSDDPYGGGWHCWKAGFKYNHVMKEMVHPVKSENVYICGEAYSNDQGWAEGALETAESLLSDILTIPQHTICKNDANNPMRRLRYAR